MLLLLLLLSPRVVSLGKVIAVSYCGQFVESSFNQIAFVDKYGRAWLGIFLHLELLPNSFSCWRYCC